tara:strand:- start:295 stop:639 length:345 start_codon:yes stop_codon:yes gene_type:complete
MKKPAYLFGYPVFFSYIYGVNEARSHAFKIKIKVMNNKERVNLANSYIVGYAKDFITDEECNDMIDLVLNETSIVNGDGIIWDNTFNEEAEIENMDIKIECSLAQDNEWANESI